MERPQVLLLIGCGVIASVQIGKAMISIPLIRRELAPGLDLAGLIVATFANVQGRTDAAIDAEDVLGHCRGKVASFKLPRHVVFVDAFPMTVSGKIRKAELREDSRKLFEEGAS